MLQSTSRLHRRGALLRSLLDVCSMYLLRSSARWLGNPGGNWINWHQLQLGNDFILRLNGGNRSRFCCGGGATNPRGDGLSPHLNRCIKYSTSTTFVSGIITC